jgi:hypothetical protein
VSHFPASPQLSGIWTRYKNTVTVIKNYNSLPMEKAGGMNMGKIKHMRIYRVLITV